MKKNIIIVLALCLAVLSTSCSKEFLKYSPPTSMPDDKAFENLTDIEAATIGMYNSFKSPSGSARFQLAGPEINTDNAYIHSNGSNWHILHQQWSFSVTDGDLSGLWSALYQNVDRAARIIQGVGIYLGQSGHSQAEIDAAKLCRAQAYGVKALASFYLVNWFALPYSSENLSKPGIIIVGDEPITAADAVSRGTVAATYAQIENDIAAALTEFGTGDLAANNRYFFMNKAAVIALKARVKLYKGEWSEAYTAANDAIAARAGSLVMTAAAYKAMWASTAASSEDIFTIGRSESDNSGSSSLASFWGTYGCVVSESLKALYAPTDWRSTGLICPTYGSLSDTTAKSIEKYQNNLPYHNQPLIRLPEMYLIAAEAAAEQNQITQAQTALFNVAKKNSAFASATALPSTKDDLLNFIRDERRRELVGEGHRYFDIRRRGELVTRRGTGAQYDNWDAKKFCYPIPDVEVRTSGIEQNDWSANLPS